MGEQADAMFSPGDIMRRLREVEEKVDTARRERRLTAASIGSGGLTVKGGGSIRSDTFDGDPASVIRDPGTEGWALGADGLVVNTMKLRDGIINPESLESPVDFSADSVFGLFDLTTTETEFLSATATIPEYATEVVILAICFMELNPTGDQMISVRNGVSAPGSSGSTLGRQHGHSGMVSSVTVPRTVLREDSDAFPLGGATVTATLEASVDTGTSSNNFATLDLQVIAGRPLT